MKFDQIYIELDRETPYFISIKWVFNSSWRFDSLTFIFFYKYAIVNVATAEQKVAMMGIIFADIYVANKSVEVVFILNR
jgi:hypothetical protein